MDFADYIEWKESQGDGLNHDTRQKLKEFYLQNGSAWLGNINLYPERSVEDSFKDWDGVERIFNFSYSFAVPQRDEILYTLIVNRSTAKYEGTEKDSRLIAEIFNRIAELKGIHLIWN